MEPSACLRTCRVNAASCSQAICSVPKWEMLFEAPEPPGNTRGRDADLEAADCSRVRLEVPSFTSRSESALDPTDEGLDGRLVFPLRGLEEDRSAGQGPVMLAVS